MLRYPLMFIASTLVFCVLDALWLGVVAADLYRRELGPLLLEQPRWGVATAFYVLFIIGILVFAVQPAQGSLASAAARGALFGFFTYMTYDLTNLATLRGWSAIVVAADISWGCLAAALAATAGCWVGSIVAAHG